MFENKRTAVFVDLISIFYNVNFAYPHRKLNYKAYLDRLKGRYNICRAIAYGASVGNEAQNFIRCLKGNGYETKYVLARKFNSIAIIKYTDRTMDIAMDIMRMEDRIDIAVIGSCNPNLIPLYVYLKEKGIKIITYACNIPRNIKDSCDEWWEITEDLLEIKNDVEDELEEGAVVENTETT
jgi:uncharacterized LabA/DUF88 family protein